MPMTLAFSCEVVHKTLWKSVNICKSYSKKTSGTFFSWTRCSFRIYLHHLTGQGCCLILENSAKIFVPFSPGLLRTMGYEKSRFDQYLALSRKQYNIWRNYNARRIETRIQSIEWYNFQWSWVTSNLDFKVTIFFSVKKLKYGTMIDW